MEIRLARIDDAADIAVMRRENGVREGVLALTSERSSAVRKFLGSLESCDRAFAAEEDGRLAGLAVLLQSREPRRSHCASVAIMVAAENQGAGIGSALMKRLLDEADQTLKIHRLELMVLADNKAAVALYRKNGFNIEARRKRAAVKDGAFVDEFLMARIRGEATA